MAKTSLGYILYSVFLVTAIEATFNKDEAEGIYKRIIGRYSNKYKPYLQGLRNIHSKRAGEMDEKFNTCDQETPFPCQSSPECISLKHVCDGNIDCTDGYDENESVCIAYQRVPVEDLRKFVVAQARWMVPAFFSEVVQSRSDLETLANKLSISPTIEAFQMKMGLSRSSARNFEKAINAVRDNDVKTLEIFGMKPQNYNSVKFVFNSLITSGFLN